MRKCTLKMYSDFIIKTNKNRKICFSMEKASYKLWEKQKSNKKKRIFIIFYFYFFRLIYNKGDEGTEELKLKKRKEREIIEKEKNSYFRSLFFF